MPFTRAQINNSTCNRYRKFAGFGSTKNYSHVHATLKRTECSKHQTAATNRLPNATKCRPKINQAIGAHYLIHNHNCDIFRAHAVCSRIVPCLCAFISRRSYDCNHESSDILRSLHIHMRNCTLGRIDETFIGWAVEVFLRLLHYSWCWINCHWFFMF